MSDKKYQFTKDELRELLGESIHTAFRKGCFHPSAAQIHQLIRDMPPEDWDAAVDWVVYCLCYGEDA